VAGWIAVAALAVAAALTFGGAQSEAIRLPGSDAERVLDELDQRFPEQAGGRAIAVFSIPVILSGERNWWIPGWLDRLLPHLDVQGADHDPASAGSGHGNGRAEAAPAVVDVRDQVRT
jgi:uncharacterized membrane protein YdfJ with MMPL/SSD domain